MSPHRIARRNTKPTNPVSMLVVSAEPVKGSREGCAGDGWAVTVVNCVCSDASRRGNATS